MKYTTPEFTATGSALAFVQQQSAATKCSLFVDRADLQIYAPFSCVAVKP